MLLTPEQNNLIQFITAQTPCASVKFTQDQYNWAAQVQSGDTIHIQTFFAEDGSVNFNVLVMNDDDMVEVEQAVNNIDELEIASYHLQNYFSAVFLGSTVYRIIRSFTTTLSLALQLQGKQIAA